ncbi:flagellar motor protein [Motiliproteus sp. SC1-56]|uniref:flagellar motor protein n=1 Tax=Motiliproteus sp. SC1-56 TaxID=2799565 RepID=UPI001A8FE8D9|nr:flagellar motor protein [Motiliproteus sp. SC1-56]
MDRLSLFGLILALLAILGGSLFEGGSLSTLFNGAAAIIVFGGTLGAALLQTPLVDLQRALGLFRWIFGPPRLDFNRGIEKVVGWSVHARRYGLLGLEKQGELENDPFLRKGLQLIADGGEPEVVREIMEVEVNVCEQRDLQAIRFYESMGGYAPTIGIIGAVMGLIHVMTNLGNPTSLGLGIATAFVSTIYGVGIANLFFLPVASKLRSIVFRQYQYREMMLDGMLAIVQGHNPGAIRVKLEGYLK